MFQEPHSHSLQMRSAVGDSKGGSPEGFDDGKNQMHNRAILRVTTHDQKMDVLGLWRWTAQSVKLLVQNDKDLRTISEPRLKTINNWAW